MKIEYDLTQTEQNQWERICELVDHVTLALDEIPPTTGRLGHQIDMVQKSVDGLKTMWRYSIMDSINDAMGVQFDMVEPDAMPVPKSPMPSPEALREAISRQLSARGIGQSMGGE